MSLSSEEIKAARRMYRFVRNMQRSNKLIRWGLGPLLCLNGLIQVHQNANAYSYFFLDVAILLSFVGYAVETERQRRYRDAVVIMGVIEREHPNEFGEIKVEQAVDEGKLRLFERTN